MYMWGCVVSLLSWVSEIDTKIEEPCDKEETIITCNLWYLSVCYFCNVSSESWNVYVIVSKSHFLSVNSRSRLMFLSWYTLPLHKPLPRSTSISAFLVALSCMISFVQFSDETTVRYVIRRESVYNSFQDFNVFQVKGLGILSRELWSVNITVGGLSNTLYRYTEIEIRRKFTKICYSIHVICVFRWRHSLNIIDRRYQSCEDGFQMKMRFIGSTFIQINVLKYKISDISFCFLLPLFIIDCIIEKRWW